MIRTAPLGYPWLLLAAILLPLLFTACAQPAASLTQREQVQVSLSIDGETYNLTSPAANVRQLLEEAGISVTPADQVSPPPFTPLTAGMTVTVVRVREEIEVIEESLPFERKIVRSEALEADEPPRIIQGGRNGLQEITVRTVFHDGVEVERQRTQITVVQEPQDEIVMVGVGSAPGVLRFDGMIAFNRGGNALILRGSTLSPEQLNVAGRLDGRVFKLSPTGNYLLYTQALTETNRFGNSLWLLSTERGAEPRPLGVENVLWADWNPSRTASLQIAYTTANPVNQPPGWEANNDLWLATIFSNEEFPFNPQQLVEAYPATYGWWGGNFAFSPDGRHIAYAYADEVGLIDLQATASDDRRLQLHRFTEYNTRAEWVWVPTLSWSPDGQYLAFSLHGSQDPEAMSFDIWVADVDGEVVLPFVQQAGMWSHPHWSPPFTDPLDSSNGRTQLAYLQASNPLDSLRSPYNLWLMDQDGSNAHQAYPPVGENSRFPQEEQFMAWGPSGRDIAFVFDDTLYLLNLQSGQAHRIIQDDTVVSLPTWAPYGAAVTEEIQPTEVIPTPSGQESSDTLLPEEP